MFYGEIYYNKKAIKIEPYREQERMACVMA